MPGQSQGQSRASGRVGRNMQEAPTGSPSREVLENMRPGGGTTGQPNSLKPALGPKSWDHQGSLLGG